MSVRWKNLSSSLQMASLKKTKTKKKENNFHIACMYVSPYVEFNEVSWSAFLCLNMFLHCQHVSLRGEIQSIDTSGRGNPVQDDWKFEAEFQKSWSDAKHCLTCDRTSALFEDPHVSHCTFALCFEGPFAILRWYMFLQSVVQYFTPYEGKASFYSPCWVFAALCVFLAEQW